MSQALHQQQLEQQEQTESKVRKFNSRYGEDQFQTHIHSDDDTVWFHISNDTMNFRITVSREVARQIAKDLFDHSR